MLNDKSNLSWEWKNIFCWFSAHLKCSVSIFNFFLIEKIEPKSTKNFTPIICFFYCLRTFSDLGGGQFRLFISKIYLKFSKETTELINIWISIIDNKKFLILISKKNIAKNRVQWFYDFSC